MHVSIDLWRFNAHDFTPEFKEYNFLLKTNLLSCHLTTTWNASTFFSSCCSASLKHFGAKNVGILAKQIIPNFRSSWEQWMAIELVECFVPPVWWMAFGQFQLQHYLTKVRMNRGAKISTWLDKWNAVEREHKRIPYSLLIQFGAHNFADDRLQGNGLDCLYNASLGPKSIPVYLCEYRQRNRLHNTQAIHYYYPVRSKNYFASTPITDARNSTVRHAHTRINISRGNIILPHHSRSMNVNDTTHHSRHSIARNMYIDCLWASPGSNTFLHYVEDIQFSS